MISGKESGKGKRGSLVLRSIGEKRGEQENGALFEGNGKQKVQTPCTFPQSIDAEHLVLSLKGTKRNVKKRKADKNFAFSKELSEPKRNALCERMKIKILTFFVVLVCLGRANFVWGYCPEKCTCRVGIDSDLLVDCSDNGFSSIPSTTPNWTTTIIVKGNRISYLNCDSLPARLNTLNIADNILREISASRVTKLQNLDVSNNRLAKLEFLTEFPNLRSLNLAGNEIRFLNVKTFINLPHLEELNLNSNPVTTLPSNLFSGNRNLASLYLSDLGIYTLPNSIFDPLHQLKHVSIAANNHLNFIPSSIFQENSNLSIVNLANNQLTTLPRSLNQLALLRYLDVSGNPLVCDCRSFWFVEWYQSRPEVELTNSGSSRCIRLDHFLEKNCSFPLLGSRSLIESKLGDPITLSCETGFESIREVVWVSPSEDIINDTSAQSDWTPMPKGHLVIQSLDRHSAGTYECRSYDPVTDSNVTASVKVRISTVPLRRVQIQSLYAGAACCLAFIVLTGIAQAFRYLMDYMGWWDYWYCCGKTLSPRAKQIRHFLEDVEQYKSAQLDRLRENYQMQVNKIRENCTQQIERLRDSYQGQVKYLRGVRDSGTQHLTTLREQYADQARKVYDYSCDRVARVRRNYVTQRARVRKFSAHQLIRLRETYKFQQKTLNKILENIPAIYLDNCRSAACARTDSIYFDDEPDVDIVNSILKQSITIALPDDIDEEVSGTPPDAKTPLEQTVAEENRNRKRGHARQASAGSLDFSAFFPPIRFPSRISWRRRNPETNVQVSVEVCANPSLEEVDNDINEKEHGIDDYDNVA